MEGLPCDRLLWTTPLDVHLPVMSAALGGHFSVLLTVLVKEAYSLAVLVWCSCVRDCLHDLLLTELNSSAAQRRCSTSLLPMWVCFIVPWGLGQQGSSSVRAWALYEVDVPTPAAAWRCGLAADHGAPGVPRCTALCAPWWAQQLSCRDEL